MGKNAGALADVLTREPDVGGGQARIAGDDVEPLADGDGRLGRMVALDEDVVQAAFAADPKGRADVSLRVGVDEEHLLATLGRAGGHVHGRRGLSRASLLVQDGDAAGPASAKALDPEEGLAALQGAEVLLAFAAG